MDFRKLGIDVLKARAQSEQLNIPEAEHILRNVVDFIESKPDSLKLHFIRHLGSALTGLGTLHMLTERYEGAESLYLKALGIRETLAEAGTDQDKDGLASILNNIGILYRVLGNIKGADEVFRKSIAIRQELFQYENELEAASFANTLSNYALTFSDMNHPDLAIKHLRESLSILRELDKLSSIDFSFDIAKTLNNLGNQLRFTNG